MGPIEILPKVPMGEALALICEFFSCRAEAEETVPSGSSQMSNREAFYFFDPIPEGHLF